MTSTVGEYVCFQWSSDHPSSVEVFWEIGPMSKILYMTEKFSPVFKFRNQAWRLRLQMYHFGAYSVTQNLNKTVYLDVMREKPSNCAEVGQCYLRLKRSDGIEQTVGIKKFITKYQDSGWVTENRFELTPSLLKEDREAVMPRDHLALACRISMMEAKVTVMEAFTQTEEPECGDVKSSEEQISRENVECGLGAKGRGVQSLNTTVVASLIQNLKDLYVSAKNSDVTIKVKDDTFAVHRAVLGARTPVLAAMFSHDMVEKETGVIKVEDCDPEAFDIFLRFVYSGETEKLTPENAMSVYSIADKYDLPELKRECVPYIVSTLTIDTICNVITIAAKYDDKPLLERAMSFFMENAQEIFNTLEWERFMVNNSTQAKELMILAVKHSREK